MLSKEQIDKNKDTFRQLVSKISRLSADDISNIFSYLESSDFFIAPASTKYHGAYDGGLCEHSINVCYALLKLYDTFKFKLEDDDVDSLYIVSLFHDLAKVNFYKKELKHRKVNSGWEDYYGYSVLDCKDRFILGNHEETCAYLTSTLVPLRASEFSAILNHHATLSWDSAKSNIGEIYQLNPLAQFLHYADSIDAYSSDVNCI